MNSKTLERKINNLSSEVARMRSLLIGIIGRDSEGEYRPEFVKEILKIAEQEKSQTEFTTPADLLKRIR